MRMLLELRIDDWYLGEIMKINYMGYIYDDKINNEISIRSKDYF